MLTTEKIKSNRKYLKRQRTCYNELNIVRVRNHNSWMNLISSEWFLYFLRYLNFEDIAKLDLAICNHEDRIPWLILLTKHSVSCLKIPRKRFVDKFTNWLILKSIHSTDLEISLAFKRDKIPELSDEILIQLINNCSHLKRLGISSSSLSHKRNLSAILSNSIGSFSQLEILKLVCIDLTENDFDLLSQTCHGLKVIHLQYSTVSGINNLLKVNRNIEEIDIQPYGKDHIITGDMFEALGQYCSLLQRFTLCCNHLTKITHMQIETFTSGCRYLKYLDFSSDKTSLKIFDKLLLCLGMYNPLLEELTFCYQKTNSPPLRQTYLTNESMKMFSI